MSGSRARDAAERSQDAIARRTERGAAHVRRILAEVCSTHNLSPKDILTPRRHRSVAWPRQEIMYRAVMETSASLPVIGRELERHHSTVLNGFRKHAKRLGELSPIAPFSPLSRDCPCPSKSQDSSHIQSA